MTLEILDWHDGDLLAKPVFDKLNGLVAAGVPESKILGVTINADEESDTDLWCPKYGIPFEITGNVVVVHTHKNRKAPPDFAAAFVTADTPARSERRGQAHAGGLQSQFRADRRCRGGHRHGIRRHVADRFAQRLAVAGGPAHSVDSETVFGLWRSSVQTGGRWLHFRRYPRRPVRLRIG